MHKRPVVDAEGCTAAILVQVEFHINMSMPLGIKRFLLWLCIAAAIIVPFIIWGEGLGNLVKMLMDRQDAKYFVAFLVIALLSLDILLPVPSSFVSTMGGFFLGIFWGTICSLAGMMISSCLGYFLGSSLGRAAIGRFIGQSELEKMERLGKSMREWIVIVFRGVPVLAEVSVVFAGMAKVPFPLFLLLVFLSNLCVSLVYSIAGTLSSGVNSFLLAFGLCMVVSLVTYFTGRIIVKRHA